MEGNSYYQVCVGQSNLHVCRLKQGLCYPTQPSTAPDSCACSEMTLHTTQDVCCCIQQCYTKGNSAKSQTLDMHVYVCGRMTCHSSLCVGMDTQGTQHTKTRLNQAISRPTLPASTTCNNHLWVPTTHIAGLHIYIYRGPPCAVPRNTVQPVTPSHEPGGNAFEGI